MATIPNLNDGTFHAGRRPVHFTATVARTDTSAKTLFTIPAGAFPLSITVSSPAASNAGTTATLSIGTSGGSGTTWVNAQDVKTAATGQGAFVPGTSGSAKFGASLAAAETLTGTYAETGTASSAGGPWVVTVLVLVD